MNLCIGIMTFSTLSSNSWWFLTLCMVSDHCWAPRQCFHGTFYCHPWVLLLCGARGHQPRGHESSCEISFLLLLFAVYVILCYLSAFLLIFRCQVTKTFQVLWFPTTCTHLSCPHWHSHKAVFSSHWSLFLGHLWTQRMAEMSAQFPVEFIWEPLSPARI